MTAFGKYIALACALLLVALLSGLFWLFTQQSGTLTAVATLPRLQAAAPAPAPAAGNVDGSGLSSSQGDLSRLVAPSGPLPTATNVTMPDPVSLSPQAPLSYRSAGLNSPRSVQAPASAPASSGDVVSPGRGGAAPIAFSSTTGTTGTTGTPRGTTTIPILMYHYVRVVTNARDILGQRLSVTPYQFSVQMQYLADHGYTTLTMHDVYAILDGQEALPVKPIALTFDDGYEDFYTQAWPVLEAHNFKATSYIITRLIGGSAYMSWDQIRQLDATGMVDFGAHTEHHVDLRALGTPRLWNEVNGSKLDLEQELGHTVTDFCYPSGEYNSRVIAAVEKAGFETATTTHYGDRQNLNWNLTIPRIRVTGPNGFRFWVASLP